MVLPQESSEPIGQGGRTHAGGACIQYQCRHLQPDAVSRPSTVEPIARTGRRNPTWRSNSPLPLSPCGISADDPR